MGDINKYSTHGLEFLKDIILSFTNLVDNLCWKNCIVACGHSNKCSSATGWGAGRGRARRRRGQAVASWPRAAPRVRSFRARRIRREHGRKRGPSHGVRGLVEAPHARRLRGALRARRLQLRRAARAAELRALSEPPAQDRAEGPQAVLQVPQLYLREVYTDGWPAASDGTTDCYAACPGAGRGARAGRDAGAGRGAGAAGAAGGEGAAQPRGAAAALAGLGQLRLGPRLARSVPVRAAAALHTAAASDAASAAATTAGLVILIFTVKLLI